MCTDSFLLYCFHAFTGLKIILICNKSNKDGNNCLKNIYEVYSDFVQKDPAYNVKLIVIF